MTERLYVVLYGEVAGELTRTTPASPPTFTYTPDYLASASVPLSVRLPLRAEPYPAARVLPYLTGLLPENREVRERWAATLGVADTQPFTLLSAMGWDCPGAVQFTPPERLDEMRERADDRVVLSDGEIADRLRELHADETSWTLPDEHWSLAGMQAKFALTRKDGRWYRAEGSAPTTHIIKPGIARLHHQALVEHVTMRAAALSGVTVAGSEYRQFDGEWAVVIERFDRIRGGDGDVLRLHQEDFAQATGTMPENKYEAPRGPGLKAFMSVVRTVSTAPRADALALLDFAAVNYVAGAPDGHAKNLALFAAPGLVRIAPLYDLATGLTYDPDGGGMRQVAVSIGGRRKLGEVMPRHWDRAALTLGLASGEVRERVRKLASHFPDAIATALNEAKEAPGASEVRQRTLDRIARHVARLVETLGRRLPATPEPNLSSDIGLSP